MTLPATTEKRLQLVPNSYERGIPETTPMAKATAKILVQNRASVWKWGLPVRRQSTRSVAMNAETPMREGRKDDVEADGKGELQARQQQGVSFHRAILHPLRGGGDPSSGGFGAAGTGASSCFDGPTASPPAELPGSLAL